MMYNSGERYGTYMWLADSPCRKIDQNSSKYNGEHTTMPAPSPTRSAYLAPASFFFVVFVFVFVFVFGSLETAGVGLGGGSDARARDAVSPIVYKGAAYGFLRCTAHYIWMNVVAAVNTFAFLPAGLNARYACLRAKKRAILPIKMFVERILLKECCR